MREFTDEEWDKARSMAIAGVPFKEIKEAVGIPVVQITKRSEAEHWSTPLRVKRAVHREIRAQKEQSIKEVRDEIAERYANERISHRETILATVKTALKNMDPNEIEVKSVKDLKMLDEVQRRNLGMDLEDESNVKRINPALYPVQSE